MKPFYISKNKWKPNFKWGDCGGLKDSGETSRREKKVEGTLEGPVGLQPVGGLQNICLLERENNNSWKNNVDEEKGMQERGSDVDVDVCDVVVVLLEIKRGERKVIFIFVITWQN